MSDTAPIGPATVTVLGYHWRAGPRWDGFDFARAELRSHCPLGEDYHLSVPWMHPDDKAQHADDPDCWCIYRLRLKRGWKSFVQVDGAWHVSRAPRQDSPPFGTPPWGQIRAVVEVTLAARVDAGSALAGVAGECGVPGEGELA